MARRRLLTVLPLVALAAAGVAVSLLSFPDVLFTLTGLPDPAAAVGSDDLHLRRAAARSLARHGEGRADAVPALEAALARSDDGEHRWLCVCALTRMGPAAGPALDRLAFGPRNDPAARLAATARPFPETAAELVNLLDHPNPAVRDEARSRLKPGRPAAADAVPLLVATCRRQVEAAAPPPQRPTDDPAPRFDPANLPATVPIVFLPPHRTAEPDAVLADLGAAAVPAVCRAARECATDPTPPAGRFRTLLFGVLTRIGPPIPEALPLLAEAARSDPDPVARAAAVDARRQLDPAVVPELVRELEAAGAVDAAIPVLNELRRHGPAAAAATPAVTRVLGTAPDPWVRVEAARTLAAVGETGPAVTALAAALSSPEPTGAAEALGQLGPASIAAVPALLSAARRTDLSQLARTAVRKALDRVTRPDPDHLADELDPAVRPDDGPAEALVECGPAAVPAVARVLATGPPAARTRAAAVLGKVRPVTPEAVAALTDALADPDPDRRAEAAWALGTLGPDAAAAVPDLLRAAREAGSPDRAATFRDAARAVDPVASAAAAEPGRAYQLAAAWAGLGLAGAGWLWYRRRTAPLVHPPTPAAR